VPGVVMPGQATYPGVAQRPEQAALNRRATRSTRVTGTMVGAARLAGERS
jgi:hypothetical protein